VTVVGDRTILGFNPNQLSQALEIGIDVAPRDPAETLPLLGRVLEAVERAVRQMPDDTLDWTAPDRDRPMRQFVYHIFMVSRTSMRGLAAGEYEEWSDTTGPSYGSFREIADFGRSVVDEYTAWVAQQDAQALSCLGPRGSDERSAAERLDLVTGHTVQHLRQLYFVLESFGVAPEDRLEDSEFPPEYVLTILW
jgi:hypothetical protein